mgnify:FL=1
MLEVSRREAFALVCLRHLGDVVLWGALDCSDLIARGELGCGLPDRRATHTVQTYADQNPESAEKPRLGDLGFFGYSWRLPVHVVSSSFGGMVLSADGATRAIQQLDTAARIPSARVRLHENVGWYRSAPFLGWRRHHELDS